MSQILKYLVSTTFLTLEIRIIIKNDNVYIINLHFIIKCGIIKEYKGDKYHQKTTTGGMQNENVETDWSGSS